jgi:hypothetical protein
MILPAIKHYGREITALEREKHTREALNDKKKWKKTCLLIKFSLFYAVERVEKTMFI